jgi:hypothetical protein
MIHIVRYHVKHLRERPVRIQKARLNARGTWNKPKYYSPAEYEKAIKKVENMYPRGKILHIMDTDDGWDFWIETDAQSIQF